MSKLLAAALATLALAAPASAAEPIAVHHERSATAIALAGPDVLVLRERGSNGGVKLVAVPRKGGAARTLLQLPEAGLSYDADRLAASPQRVAVIVGIDGTATTPPEYRVYSGPPSGPLRMVVRTPDPDGEAFEPLFVSVDGDRLLLVEAKVQSEPSDPDVRARILDPAKGWVPIRWATQNKLPVAIAGRYAAVSGNHPRRIALADLATGTVVTRLAGQVIDRLHADVTRGGQLVGALRSGLQVASPQRTLANSRGLSFAHFAGTSVAAIDKAAGMLTLMRADGTRRTVGPRSLILTDMEADEAGVAWVFNGCVRYLPLAAATAPAAKQNVCPTTEIGLYLVANSRLRGATATTPVQCVNAPSKTCRGTLIATLDGRVVGRGRFVLPQSKKWVDVPIRFDRKAIARFKKDGDGGVIVDAKIKNGSVGAGSDGSSELTINLNEPKGV